MSAIRAYVNPHPRHTADGQRLRLSGKVYKESRKGTVIDVLIKSIRKGDVIQVLELGLLAPTDGWTKTRREVLADRVERIKARGGSIFEVSTGHTSKNGHLPRMMVRAAEFIAHSGRVGKSSKRGQPAIVLTPEQDEIGWLTWRSREFTKDDGPKGRVTAVNKRLKELGLTRTLTRGWCWGHWKSPHATDYQA